MATSLLHCTLIPRFRLTLRGRTATVFSRASDLLEAKSGKSKKEKLPAGGVWRTINGVPVYILNGTAMTGPMKGKPLSSTVKADTETVHWRSFAGEKFEVVENPTADSIVRIARSAKPQTDSLGRTYSPAIRLAVKKAKYEETGDPTLFVWDASRGTHSEVLLSIVKDGYTKYNFSIVEKEGFLKGRTGWLEAGPVILEPVEKALQTAWSGEQPQYVSPLRQFLQEANPGPYVRDSLGRFAGGGMLAPDKDSGSGIATSVTKSKAARALLTNEDLIQIQINRSEGRTEEGKSTYTSNFRAANGQTYDVRLDLFEKGESFPPGFERILTKHTNIRSSYKDRMKDMSALKIGLFGFTDSELGYGITGRGHAKDVFSKAIRHFMAHIQEAKPDIVFFTADEESRQKLYKFFAERIAAYLPGYFGVTENAGITLVLRKSLQKTARTKTVPIQESRRDSFLDDPKFWDDLFTGLLPLLRLVASGVNLTTVIAPELVQEANPGPYVRDSLGQFASGGGTVSTAPDRDMAYGGSAREPQQTLDGEYWLNGTSSLFADGDIGDMNHEGYAVDAAIRDVADSLGVDAGDEYADFDDVLQKYAEEEPEKAALLQNPDDDPKQAKEVFDELGLDDDTWATAQGIGDPRFWAAKKKGWVRMAGNSLQMVGIDGAKMSDTAQAIGDAHPDLDDDEFESQTFDLEVVTSDSVGKGRAVRSRMYYGVPLEVLRSGDIRRLKEYGGIQEDEIQEANPYHDRWGRFTNAAGAVLAPDKDSGSGVAPKGLPSRAGTSGGTGSKTKGLPSKLPSATITKAGQTLLHVTHKLPYPKPEPPPAIPRGTGTPEQRAEQKQKRAAWKAEMEAWEAAVAKQGGVWFYDNGQPAPPHVQEAKISSTCIDVHINPDPDGDLQSYGYNRTAEGGRSEQPFYKYSNTHNVQRNVTRFAHSDPLMEHADAFMAALAADRHSHDPKTRDIANAFTLILSYGMRVGNKESRAGYESRMPVMDPDTGKQAVGPDGKKLWEIRKVQTYGATTVEPRHVKVAALPFSPMQEGDEGGTTQVHIAKGQVYLQYRIEKSKKVGYFPIDDPDLAKELLSRKKAAKSETDLLFPEALHGRVMAYFRGLAKSLGVPHADKLKLKSLRTAVGTSVALRVADAIIAADRSQHGEPKTQKDVERLALAIATEVAKELKNQPSMSKNFYVNWPRVLGEYLPEGLSVKVAESVEAGAAGSFQKQS